MNCSINNRRAAFNRLLGQQRHIEKELKEYEVNLKKIKENIEIIREALTITKAVGIATQSSLQKSISELSTLAINTVFEEGYELSVEFVEKRGKTECELYLTQNKNRVDPMTACGGGLIEVVAFALRLTAKSMQVPQKRNILIMDEPFSKVSAQYISKVGDLVRKLCFDLGMQVIIVTHSLPLAEAADNVITVRKKDGVSIVGTTE